MPSFERWKKFSRRDQLGHIGVELYRASLVQKNDPRLAKAMLERALELVDFTIDDPKWRPDALMLLKLRVEIAKAYIDKTDIERVYAMI